MTTAAETAQVKNSVRTDERTQRHWACPKEYRGDWREGGVDGIRGFRPMTTDANVVDSRDPSVVEHVRRYIATDGRSGYLEGGMTNLILTYTGRRSGQRYRTGLFFGEDNGRYVLVASGGAITQTHPQWYLSVRANPVVEVQILAERFTARARTTSGAERSRLWAMMTAQAPIYLRYEILTRDREIPVVVLERLARGADA